METENARHIYNFVDIACNRYKMMEILHNNNYSAVKANSIRCDSLDATQFTNLECDFFERLIINDMGKLNKSFSRIAKALGKSVSAVLIHYYGVFKGTEAYKNVKQRQIEDSEWCSVCQDGGDLINCDSCRRWYHPNCVGLKIKDIPKGKWFCFNCSDDLNTDETTNESMSALPSTPSRPPQAPSF